MLRQNTNAPRKYGKLEGLPSPKNARVFPGGTEKERYRRGTGEAWEIFKKSEKHNFTREATSAPAAKKPAESMSQAARYSNAIYTTAEIRTIEQRAMAFP